VALVPLVSRFGSRHHLVVPTSLAILLARSLVISADYVHAGSYLTSADGLRRQVAIVAAALSMSPALAVSLAPYLGAAGPVVGTVCGGAAALLATFVLANRESLVADLQRVRERTGRDLCSKVFDRDNRVQQLGGTSTDDAHRRESTRKQL
jgi:hypothetical protein